MKIGPINVGVAAIAYTAGCVVMSIVCLALWKIGDTTRYQAYYREKIMRGVSDGMPESHAAGINAARELLSKAPEILPAQFYIANIQALQGFHADARASYDALLKNPKLTPQEKAIASTAAGVSLFLAAEKKDQAKAAAEAQTYFRAAIEADATYADAHANLALAQPYINPEGWIATAEGPAQKALEAAIPPTADALENLYRLQSVILKEKKLAKEALAALDAAQGVKPSSGKNSESLRTATRLASLIDKSLSSDIRRKNIEELEKDMSKLSDRPTMANASIAIGIAWMSMNAEADWIEKCFPSAARSFLRATDQDGQNRLSYHNLSALYDIRTQEVAQTLTGTATGFKGITPPLPPATKTSPRPKHFPPADKPALTELRRLQRETEDLWKRFIDRATPTPEERTDAQIRMVMAMRRQAYTMDTDEESAAKVLRERALLLVKDMETRLPEDANVAMLAGMLLLDMRREAEAVMRFEKAHKLGAQSPLLTEIMASFGGKPQLVSARPIDGQRWFGARPLVSATLHSPGAGDGFRSVEMKHNGQPISGSMVGSQVLYFPTEAQLTDGKHTIEFSVTEAVSNKRIDFPPLEFHVDKLAPSIRLVPDGGDTNPSAQFNVIVNDPTGVDLASIKVIYKSTDQSKNPLNRAIVSNGRYSIAAADDGIKMGSNLTKESFKIAAGTPLPEGGYVVEIIAKDLTGNETRLNKGFYVKK